MAKMTLGQYWYNGYFRLNNFSKNFANIQRILSFNDANIPVSPGKNITLFTPNRGQVVTAQFMRFTNNGAVNLNFSPYISDGQNFQFLAMNVILSPAGNSVFNQAATACFYPNVIGVNVVAVSGTASITGTIMVDIAEISDAIY